ncbi:MAG: tRNA (guanosine(46)-N7)-methyltransferase TrmB, partial [Verrucomicrobia bacterium]|nr:tRNA (guanosine(46)-N7)-methyltransferase TrmB [Verrucomicrobiota bacterium]
SGTAEESFQIVPNGISKQLNFAEIYRNDHPVEVDLGSGHGSFLLESAAKFPERNFLGVERLLGRTRKTRRQAFRRALTNVRVLQLEIDYTAGHLLPEKSVSRIHLSFPDPWPKRRHHHRRVVNDAFLQSIWRVLLARGELRIKTDYQDYFAYMLRVVEKASTCFEALDWNDSGYPATDFESRFKQDHRPIYRLRLCKRV